MSKNELLTIGKKLLFIQPKTSDIQELKLMLSQHNYEVIQLSTPNPYLLKKILIEESPHAILVEISMFQNRICCSEMVEIIKGYHLDIKVVFLTDAIENYAVEVAKACYASAYLLKPCRVCEVLVTLELIFNETKKKIENNYQLSYGYIYSLEKKQLIKDNQEEILLSKNAQKLMELLVRNKGCTLPFEQILYHIWNRDYSLGSLRSLIYRIHEQIGVPLIENIKGIGYRIN